MGTSGRKPFTYARFIELTKDLSDLEDLLRNFLNEEVAKTEHDQEAFGSIIAEQIKLCASHRRGIRTHLEKCREWDTFPDDFWNENDGQHIAGLPERYPCGSDSIIDPAFVTEEIRRIAGTAENCLRDYQHSGYIGHQPVAIDFLDRLVDIHSQLYDMCNRFEIIRSRIHSVH